MNINVETIYMLYIVPKFNENTLIPTITLQTTTGKRQEITEIT